MDHSNPILMDVYQLKTMLDAELFPLAAKYRTPEEVIELRQILDEQKAAINDARRFIELDEAFHMQSGRHQPQQPCPDPVGHIAGDAAGKPFEQP